MKNKFIIFISLTLILSLATSGCTSTGENPADANLTNNNIYGQKQSIYDLSASLSADTNELSGIPWLSSFEAAYQTLGLDAVNFAVAEPKAGIIEVAFPVVLEPFGQDAQFVLQYAYQYAASSPLEDGVSRLTEVSFILTLADDAAVREALNTLLDVADRPAFAREGMDRRYSDAAKEVFFDSFFTLIESGEGGFLQLDMTHTAVDEQLDRQGVTDILVEYYPYPTEDMAKTMHNARIVRIMLTHALRPIR